MSENVNQENKQEQENTDTPETQPQQEPSPETAEETFTVTRDQMEKMEQLAKMVSDASDKYLRLAAEYDNYRKRTAKEKDGIYQDANFTANIEGALAAGLDVGVYFFSQAVSTEEAVEEAKATLEWIADYEITYPVVFDWEEITYDEARTDSVDPETVTQCVKAFCDTVQEAGYIPMVYFNKNQGYDIMNLEELAGYEFWLAGYSESPSFEYAFEMWQYSATGTVTGIQGNVDLNICLVDYGT